jgi:hypothetical protein
MMDQTVLPLRVDTPERFAALRDLLTRARYQSEPICARLGLIRLFIEEEHLDRRVVQSLLPAADIDTLESIGLLTSDDADGKRYRSSVLLYPTDSLYIASDRTPPAAESSPASDLVYSAISDSTRSFLDLVPSDSCESFLELCAGTGRATHFARFNGLLNGIDNFTAVQGDLFQAVPGQTFDRICAHPPYMPAVEQALLYQDGGQDGEQITRRIVEGLPPSLREGAASTVTA